MSKPKKATLAKKYRELENLVRDNAAISEQARGFELERLFFQLLELEKIECFPSYKTDSEQIDALFLFENKYFFTELKWTKGTVPVSEVYSFQGKMRNKFVGSLGLFISMNGFSSKVNEQIEKNTILFDKSDLDFCFYDDYTFSEILKVKLNRAVQYGILDYHFTQHLIDQKLK
jgi:Restriction endonuclease